MNRKCFSLSKRWLMVLTAALVIGAVGFWLLGKPHQLLTRELSPDNVVKVDELPAIYPDYIGVTIPVEMAPLNFSMVDEAVTKVDVVLRGQKGGELHAKGGYADFDVDKWHELVKLNIGAAITVTVCAKKDGKWYQYRDFYIHVSEQLLSQDHYRHLFRL